MSKVTRVSKKVSQLMLWLVKQGITELDVTIEDQENMHLLIKAHPYKAVVAKRRKESL